MDGEHNSEKKKMMENAYQTSSVKWRKKVTNCNEIHGHRI